MAKPLLRKFFHIPLTLLALLYVIFEELIWDKLALPIYDYVRRLALLTRLEGVVVGLNRYAVLVIFIVLFGVSEGLGIVALSLLAQGLPLVAAAIYLSRIPLVVVTFWLLRIAQPKLMSFGWFAFTYNGLIRIIEAIKASPVYIDLKERIHALKVQVKAWLAHPLVQKLRRLLKVNPRPANPH